MRILRRAIWCKGSYLDESIASVWWACTIRQQLSVMQSWHTSTRQMCAAPLHEGLMWKWTAQTRRCIVLLCKRLLWVSHIWGPAIGKPSAARVDLSNSQVSPHNLMVYTECPEKHSILGVIVQAAVCCDAAFRALHYCAMLVSLMLAITGMFKLYMRMAKLTDWYWVFILEQGAYLHPKHQWIFSYSQFQWTGSSSQNDNNMGMRC